MPSKANFMSRACYEKLRQELIELRRKRPAISGEIETARAMGDLRENSEYHAAKEALLHLQRRIEALDTKLRNSRIIEDEGISADKVYIGAKVVLKEVNSQNNIEWVLVSPDEANVIEGRISVESPMAQGLLGHAVGDRVKITVPAGDKEYEIIEISRE